MINVFCFDGNSREFIALKSRTINASGDYDYYTCYHRSHNCLVLIKQHYCYKYLCGENDCVIPPTCRSEYEPCEISFNHVCHLLEKYNCSHVLLIDGESGVFLVGQEFVSQIWNAEYYYGKELMGSTFCCL